MYGFEDRIITLRFVTPAFLADALGASELRSAPLKALLRQWWRDAWTHGNHPDAEAMREEEGRLFGHAWLEGPDERVKPRKWASKSQVLLSVMDWRPGNITSWNCDPRVFHSEVGDKGRSVGSHLYIYMGFGPLIYDKGTRLERRSAFHAGTTVNIRIRFPQRCAGKLLLDDALSLCNAFACVESRCRNGWGSIALEGISLPTLESTNWLYGGSCTQFSTRK